jgi:hypothetical protein
MITSRMACLIGTLLLAGELRAEIVNGGFEEGVFTPWLTVGVTSLEDGLFTPPSEGVYQALMTTDFGASAGDIELFLDLVPGSLGALLPANALPIGTGSAISTNIIASAGDVLSFDWNFLTNEAVLANAEAYDFSFWSLSNEQGAIVLATPFSPGFFPSSTVFGFETGYSTSSYTILNDGTYRLGFGVMNSGEDGGDSGLLIDNVTLTSAVPEPASVTLIFASVVLSAVGLRRRWLAKRKSRTAGGKSAAIPVRRAVGDVDAIG